MVLLVRKIEKAKWMQTDILNGEDVSADAITNCMRTRGNALSMWEVRTHDDVPDAVLAMIAQFEHLDAIDIVSIPAAAVSEAGLEIVRTPGVTVFSAFIDNHRDVVRLTHGTLGSLARLIIEGIGKGHVQRFTKARLLELLRNAVQMGRLEVAQLHDGLRRKL